MNKKMTTQIVILALILIFLVLIYIKASQTKNRSQQIIPFGYTDYSFDIIYGPSIEQIFQSHYDWDKSFGFEIASKHEPLRYENYEDIVHKRRVISYFIVPDYFNRVIDNETGDNLYPTLRNKPGSEDVTKKINDFIAKEYKEFLLEGPIHKKPRGNIYAYFGGGITSSFGTRYDLTIVYNPDIRTGKMTIREV